MSLSIKFRTWAISNGFHIIPAFISLASILLTSLRSKRRIIAVNFLEFRFGPFSASQNGRWLGD